MNKIKQNTVSTIKPREGSGRIRYWFTWNNYPSDQYKTILEEFHKEHCDCMMFAEETGEKGVPHIQGYIELNKRHLTGWLTKRLPAIAFGFANGTPQQNQAYISGWCAKKGWRLNPTFVKLGESRAKGQGKRNELVLIKRDIEAGATKKEILTRYIQARTCLRWIDELIAINSKNFAPKVEGDLKPWQQQIKDRLLAQPARKVTWLADPSGNSGKSFLGMWLRDHKDALYTSGVISHKEAAFQWNGEELVILDIEKGTQNEFALYGFIECLKNGQVQSTKYVPVIKYARKPVKVLVLANFKPDTCRFSADRWDIIEMHHNQEGMTSLHFDD